MDKYRQVKGKTYEEYVLENTLTDFDKVYFFKDTPEHIISKTKLFGIIFFL